MTHRSAPGQSGRRTRAGPECWLEANPAATAAPSLHDRNGLTQSRHPGRRPQDAVEEVRYFINAPRSYEWVIEGDVEDCFGSIHQGLLMEQVRRRVTDKRVLQLIRRFLAAGIMHEQGSLAATPSGMPQASSLSPLLSNIALSVLDRLRERVDRAAVAQPARPRPGQRPASYRMIRFADLCGSPHRSAYLISAGESTLIEPVDRYLTLAAVSIPSSAMSNSTRLTTPP